MPAYIKVELCKGLSKGNLSVSTIHTDTFSWKDLQNTITEACEKPHTKRAKAFV
jgi:hypothetical protein